MAPGSVGSATGAAEGARVLTLPVDERRTAPRRVSFSVPQLAAAAAVIAFFSAGLMWVAVNGDPDAVAEVAESTPAGGAAARAVALEGGRYDEAVTRLEDIVREGRGVLTPETLATIDESLAAIDSAIAEVESALAEDPASGLLQRMLATQQRTRLGVLQRAAAAVQAQT